MCIYSYVACGVPGLRSSGTWARQPAWTEAPMIALGEVLAVLAAVVLLSYLIDALRRTPGAPSRLAWMPSAPIGMIDVDGIRLRYVAVGDGPPLVLLHTLRTQLDMFQKIIPVLAARFHVIALDL